MKTKSVVIGLVILSSLITSCDHESIRAKGAVTVNELQLSGYTGLEVSHAFEAYVKFSDSEEKIEIEANDNLHDKIIVRTGIEEFQGITPQRYDVCRVHAFSGCL